MKKSQQHNDDRNFLVDQICKCLSDNGFWSPKDSGKEIPSEDILAAVYIVIENLTKQQKKADALENVLKTSEKVHAMVFQVVNMQVEHTKKQNEVAEGVLKVCKELRESWETYEEALNENCNKGMYL